MKRRFVIATAAVIGSLFAVSASAQQSPQDAPIPRDRAPAQASALPTHSLLKAPSAAATWQYDQVVTADQKQLVKSGKK
jgi:hypothetical protein